MFASVRVVGTGRVGGAVVARLRQRGIAIRAGRDATGDAELILLAVPDQAIPEVAQRIAIGPWVAHVSGATHLSALDPHLHRFSVHPLQTFSRQRGPEQLDGAYAAVSFETDAAAERGRWLATTLGLRPFDLADTDRTRYHAGAVVASNYLVTLHRVASRLLAESGAPPEGLVPLMTRTIENGFELTGPIARGDWSTVEAHLAELEAHDPDLVPLYRALAEATRA